MVRRTVIAVAVVAASFGASAAAMAAFNARTSNPQTVTAGTLALSADSASAAFSLSGLKPSTPTVQRCVAVTQTGQPSTNVRLYGTVTGTLAPYLQMKVERGTQSGAPSPSCNGFTPEPTAVFDGRLSTYPSSWAGGIVDAPGATETWTDGETHSYRISVSLADDEAAQGLSSSLALTWEAR